VKENKIPNRKMINLLKKWAQKVKINENLKKSKMGHSSIFSKKGGFYR
jgi:hypothetical protein